MESFSLDTFDSELPLQKSKDTILMLQFVNVLINNFMTYQRTSKVTDYVVLKKKCFQQKKLILRSKTEIQRLGAVFLSFCVTAE